MDDDGWYRGRPSGKSWAAVIIFGLIALLLLAVAVNMLLAGTGVIYDSTEPRGLKSVLESLAWLAGTIVCFLVAIHFEHQARGLPHGKIASGLEAAGGAARGRLPARRAGFRHRNGPTSTLVAGVIFTLLGAGLVVATIQAHAEADRSGYTQASGVSDTSTVTRVDNQQSCGRYSCDYYADIAVTLGVPVDGRASTVVHVANNVSYVSGQPLDVLVDPKDPGYAELPGSPYSTGSDTAEMGVFTAVMFAIGIAGIVGGLRMRARERARRRSG